MSTGKWELLQYSNIKCLPGKNAISCVLMLYKITNFTQTTIITTIINYVYTPPN